MRDQGAWRKSWPKLIKRTRRIQSGDRKRQPGIRWRRTESVPEGNFTYRRGEIRWVNLEPTIGAEAKKTQIRNALDIVLGFDGLS